LKRKEVRVGFYSVGGFEQASFKSRRGANSKSKKGTNMAEKKDEKIKLWDEVPGYDFIEEIDLPEMHSWFLDGTHSVPPWTPLYGWFWIRYCCHGLKYACDQLSIPTCKGWEMRFNLSTRM
jgi:hypothetical protein